MMSDVAMQLIAALFDRTGILRVARLSYAQRSSTALVAFYRVSAAPITLPVAVVVHMGRYAHWEVLVSTLPGDAYHVPSVAEARALGLVTNMQAMNHLTRAKPAPKPAPKAPAAKNGSWRWRRHGGDALLGGLLCRHSDAPHTAHPPGWGRAAS